MKTPLCKPRPAPLLLTALALLAGCASVGPDYRPPQTELPSRWLGADTRPADDADSATLARWWTTLGDPSLTRLVERGLAASPEIRLALARLREARAQRSSAVAERYPSIGAAAGASSSTRGQGQEASTSRSYSAGFDARWEIDLFGATRRSVEAAEAELQASAASLDDARVSLAAEIALNYVDLRAYQARLALARDNLARQQETLELVQWRAQAGLATTLEVEQARSNAEQTRAQLPSLEYGLTQSRLALETLLGLLPGTLAAELGGSAALPALPAGFALGLPAELLTRRPDLRAAERNLAARTARVGVAEAARYPGFSLSATLGLEAARSGDLGSAASLSRSLAGSLAATVFDAGRLRAAVAVQDALQEQALITYEQAVLTALQEVEDALAGLDSARSRREALAVARTSAREAATLARQRYASGITDYQTVLDTERTLLNVEDSLTSSAADAVAAAIRLYKALGGGWNSHALPPIPAPKG